MEEKVWLALVGLTPLKDNELTPNVSGAYVRIACKLTTDDLETYLNEVFNHYHYSVFEINDIKSEDTLNEVDMANEVTRQLLSDLNDDVKFAWGTFHTWR